MGARIGPAITHGDAYQTANWGGELPWPSRHQCRCSASHSTEASHPRTRDNSAGGDALRNVRPVPAMLRTDHLVSPSSPEDQADVVASAGEMVSTLFDPRLHLGPVQGLGDGIGVVSSGVTGLGTHLLCSRSAEVQASRSWHRQ